MQNILYKSKLDIKDIKERNKAFEALSDEDKRKEIVFDSLKLILEERKLRATESATGYWNFGASSLVENYNSSEQLQNALLNLNIPNCEVCARGAVMLSQIRLGNSLCANDNGITDGESGAVRGFNMLSMRLMELVYEVYDDSLADVLLWDNDFDESEIKPLVMRILNLTEDEYAEKDFEDMAGDLQDFVDENYDELFRYAGDETPSLVNILCNVLTNGDFDILDFTDYVKKYELQIDPE